MSSDTRPSWCGAGSVLNMITPLLSVVFHRLALSLTRRFVQMPCGHRVEVTRTAQLTRCVLCRHVWLAGKTGFWKTACVLTSEVRKTRTVGLSENYRHVQYGKTACQWTVSHTHSEHRFPAPSSRGRKEGCIVNQCFEFVFHIVQGIAFG